MLVTLELLQTIATDDSVERGRRSFHEGAVTLETIHEEFVRGAVQGTELYDVEVRQAPSGVEASCSCPYDGEGVCKHVVAVLLALMYRQAKIAYKPGLLPINARQRKLRAIERERPSGWPPCAAERRWYCTRPLEVSGLRRPSSAG